MAVRVRVVVVCKGGVVSVLGVLSSTGLALVTSLVGYDPSVLRT